MKKNDAPNTGDDQLSLLLFNEPSGLGGRDAQYFVKRFPARPHAVKF